MHRLLRTSSTRRSSTRARCRCALAALLAPIVLSGCASAPTNADLAEESQRTIDAINLAMDEAYLDCDGDVECIKRVHQERIRLLSMALERQINEMEEGWRRSRDR